MGKRITQVILLAALGAALWLYFFPAPEKVIRKRLVKLAESVSAKPKGNIAMAANINRIVSFFHPDVTINLQGYGRDVENINGRQELQQMAMGARQNVSNIKVEFYNIEPLVDDTGTNASVTFSALVNINDQTDPALQNLQVQMEKSGRAWLIKSVSPSRAKNSP